MNKLSGGKNSGILLVTALIAALLFAGYYYVVLPKKTEVEQVQQSVSRLQMGVSTLQDKIELIKQQEEYIATNIYGLRKKVPQNKMLLELLLNLEEIEYISRAKVLSVNFNNYDSLVLDSELGDPNPSVAPTDSQVDDIGELTIEEQEIQSEQAPVSSISKGNLPAELKMITFNVNIETPSRKNLETFVKELELLERVMRIDTIDYTLAGEVDTFAENASDITTATIQVTTFYYEGTE